MEWSGIDVQDNLKYVLLWIFPVLIGGLIVFIDFVTLGGLKRIKNQRFAKIYLPIYWFYSHITLSFLYRPILYNFIDDKYTRRLFFFSFPYIFFILGSSSIYSHNDTIYIQNKDAHSYGTQIDPYYYDDLFDRAVTMQTYLNEEVLRTNPFWLPSLISFLFHVIAIIGAIWFVKRKQGGFITFTLALLISLLVIIVGVLFSSGMTYGYSVTFSSDEKNRIIDKIIEESLYDNYFSETDELEREDKLREQYQMLFEFSSTTLSSVIGMILFLSIIGLICALIMKKDPPLDPQIDYASA